MHQNHRTMKNAIKFFFLTAIVLFAPDANSQIFSPSRIKNRAKQRAESKAEQKVNEQVDKGVDKVFDSLFGAVEKSVKGSETKSKDSTQAKKSNEPGEDEAMNMLQGLLGGMGQSVEPASVYSFDASFTMKMTLEEKGKNNDFSYKYLFSKGSNYMGAKMQAASDPQMSKQLESMEAMVFDFDKNSFYTFMNMNGQKTMMGIAIPTNTTGELVENQYGKSTYTATGKTKTILGYTCEGYKVVQENEEYLVWISKNRVQFMDKYYELFNKMSSAPNSQAMAYDVNPEIANMVKEGRMMMGMEMTDTKGTKSSMEVIEIKPNDSFSFSTEGYSNMMDVSKIMEQAQQESNE